MKLNKYQLGGGTEQSDQYAMLATSIQQAILRGQTPQAVYESLVARKMEQKMALELVSNDVQQMLESGSLEEEDLQKSKQKDADAEKALLQDQQLADEELEKDNAAEEQMNAYNQQSTDVALKKAQEQAQAGIEEQKKISQRLANIEGAKKRANNKLKKNAETKIEQLHRTNTEFKLLTRNNKPQVQNELKRLKGIKRKTPNERAYRLALQKLAK